MSVIYILKHPNNDAVSKIGESSVGAHTRISYQGINWSVFKEFPVTNERRKGIEKLIFQRLESENVNVGGVGAREIFSLSPEEAAQRVEQIIHAAIAKVKTGVRDADYWNYLATDSELKTRNKELAERAREQEEARQRKQEQQAHQEEISQRYKELTERREFLSYRYDEVHQDGWFSAILFVLSYGFSLVVGIPLVIAYFLLFGKDEQLFMQIFSINPKLAYFLVMGVATLTWMRREDRRDRIETAKNLREFDAEHVTKCMKCGRAVFKSVDPKNDREQPVHCSNCVRATVSPNQRSDVQ